MKEDDLNALLLVAAIGGIAYLLISRNANASTGGGPSISTTATDTAAAAAIPPLATTDFGVSQSDW